MEILVHKGSTCWKIPRIVFKILVKIKIYATNFGFLGAMVKTNSYFNLQFERYLKTNLIWRQRCCFTWVIGVSDLGLRLPKRSFCTSTICMKEWFASSKHHFFYHLYHFCIFFPFMFQHIPTLLRA